MAYERWVVEKHGALPLELSSHQSLGLGSLKQARKIIEKGCCSVNGVIVRTASKEVSAGDSIEVYPLEEAWQEEPCSVLYEEDNFFIINKPAGVLVDETALHAVLPDHPSFFLVHRLDKWTSGALILAKSVDAQKKLENLFRHREIRKDYLVLVDGSVSLDAGEINSSLQERKKRGGIVCRVTREGGREATTKYKVLLRAKKETLLLATPKTGRTHQIRAHLSSIGHPILGDHEYASVLRSMHRPYRQMLHSWRLFFRNPFSHRSMYVKAPLPKDFEALATSLFGQALKVTLCGL